MYRQNELLRRHALGNFGELLHAVARDPAMVIYLDSASNRKGQPNENFAREVMELFTLGEGNYEERDIKEAARAFTGWGIDLDTGEFLFRQPAHDDGVKTVLGRTGNLDGDAVLDILLAQPQTAEFVAGKLWREFVSPHPGSRRGQAHRARFPGFRLRHPGGAARDPRVGCVLRAAEPCDADQVPARSRRRHAAAVQVQDGRSDAVRLHGQPARPVPVRSSQRQGLARRRSLDQRDDACSRARPFSSGCFA